MNAAVEETGVVAHVPQTEAPKSRLPEPVERRGINEAQWRTLMNNLYPGAKAESVMMVWDYCVARRLDPLKKPCHIVPMQVKNQKGDYEWRDVVMPGIYEYRMTATRTGQYLGHSTPVYGEIGEYKGVKVPLTCAITVYRWNDQAKMRAEFPVELIFAETCATKRDGSLNQRWSTAPRQMFTKCVEAAALRAAFPDELGGTHTVEEMEGRELEPINVTPEPGRISPHPDTSGIAAQEIDKHVADITDILNQDKEAMDISNDLNEYVIEAFYMKEVVYCAVLDALKARGIVNKGEFKKWLAKANNARDAHQ